MIGLGVASPTGSAIPTVTITGTDYAFQIPANIRAGETLLAFENHGTVRHEMSIALLKLGVSTDSVIDAIIQGARRRDFIDGQGALIIGKPGEQPGPRLWIDLQRGRTYLVLCSLRDTPEQPPHVSMGMIGSFRPE